MTFENGFNNLSSGRAIKRPSMVGFVERVMVTAAESAPSSWDSNSTYTTNQKVSYGGRYYKAKSSVTAGTLPTDTTKWDLYTLIPEEYKIVFHNRAGTTYEFFYNTPSGVSRTDATNLNLSKELLGHMTKNDWFEGLAADFAAAADADSSAAW